MRPAFIGARAAAVRVYAGPPGPTTPQRVWRILITGWVFNGAVNGIGAGDVRMLEMSLKVGATAYPVSPMTSNTAPSPLVAFSSPALTGFGDLEPWNAFNHLASGAQWMDAGNATKFLGIDLGSGTTIRPSTLVLTPDSAVTVLAGFYVTGFILQGDTASPSGGGFSGSQLDYLTVTGLVQSDWTPYAPKTFAIP